MTARDFQYAARTVRTKPGFVATRPRGRRLSVFENFAAMNLNPGPVAAFAPHGAIQTLNLNNGVTENAIFNARL
jgi:hypothetical protein